MNEPTRLKENENYQYIPVTRNNQESWDIRILDGEFVETVFYFDKLQVAEDGEHLNFNFQIISTPDPDLDVNNEGLQKYVGMVLYDILENSLSNQEARQQE